MSTYVRYPASGGGGGGDISGSGAAGEVAYFDGVQSITSDGGLTWDGSILGATAFKSQAATVASAGTIRLGNTQEIAWRNAGDTADGLLFATTNTQLKWNYSVPASAAAFIVDHDDNTDAASHSRVQLLSGGASGGDPYIYFSVSGAGTFSLGIDNSDSDVFKLSNSSTLGANVWTVDSSSRMGLGGSPSAAIGIYISGPTLSGTSQWGVYSGAVSSSGATAALYGYSAATTTAAASFTVPFRYGFFNENTAGGAGSTITRDIGFGGNQPTRGGTGNAMLADNNAFSGSWFINSSGSNPSLLSGRLDLSRSTERCLNITGGTLSSDADWALISGTLPTAAGSWSGMQVNVATAGSNNGNRRGINVNLTSGYTGAQECSGASYSVSTASTGAYPYLGYGNFGFRAFAGGVTAGANFGTFGFVRDAKLNVGTFGGCADDSTNTNSRNIGAMGVAAQTSSGVNNIGGYFALRALEYYSAITQFPTVSAAIVADNGSLSVDIIKAQDNGSDVFRILNGGQIGTNQTSSATIAVGTLAAKMPIYDASGTLVGYIPIYDSIT